MKLIRIDTIIGMAVISHKGLTARSAARVAARWLRSQRIDLGGGNTATVSIATNGGCWHKVGSIAYKAP